MIGLEFPKYWIMTYAGPGSVEYTSGLVLFDNLTVPYPEWIDASLEVRTPLLPSRK